MPNAAYPNRKRQSAKTGSWSGWQAIWVLVLAACGLTVLSLFVGRVRGQSQPAYSLPVIDLPKPAPSAPQQPSNKADTPQKQEMVQEADNLLKMATELKTEVDKTTKDTLSLAVVRKAGAIEQMAHKDRTGITKDMGLR